MIYLIVFLNLSIPLPVLILPTFNAKMKKKEFQYLFPKTKQTHAILLALGVKMVDEKK